MTDCIYRPSCVCKSGCAWDESLALQAQYEARKVVPEPYTVVEGDCREVMRRWPAESIDAIVTDPPYGLEFMGREWDRFKATGSSSLMHSPKDEGRTFTNESGHMWDNTKALPRFPTAGEPFQRWCQQWAAEALRILKPGAHLLAFGGTRTHHRLWCAVEDAGFEIRDSVSWLYGSGFPKSLNLGDGRGTALKPAWEPCVVARKPLIGTVAANVERYGTGALNIDAGRVAGDGDGSRNRPPSRLGSETTYAQDEWTRTAIVERQDTTGKGRWPPNVVLGCNAPPWYTLVSGLDEGAIDAISTYYGVGEAVRAMRGDVPGDARRTSASSVLQPGVRHRQQQKAARGMGADGVSPVRGDVRDQPSLGTKRSAQVLLEDMQGQSAGASEADRHTALGRESGEDVSGEQGSDQEGRGSSLQDRRLLARGDRPPARIVASPSEGNDLTGDLHTGTPDRGSGERGPGAKKRRTSTSHQRRQDRQPTREPSGDDAGRAQPRASGDSAAVSDPHWRTGSLAERESTAPAGDWPFEVQLDRIPQSWLSYFVYSSDACETEHDADCAVALLDGQSGELGDAYRPNRIDGQETDASMFGSRTLAPTFQDRGGASRFLYVAKASRAEREAWGRLTLPAKRRGDGRKKENETGHQRTSERVNHHPTVKPLALMEWLLGLVTPPGGLVLDPFCGSGSTLVAAKCMGIRAIGIDADPESVELATQRIAAQWDVRLPL